MELNAREDIEAPLDRVFAEITDFETIQRQAMRRGVEVQRTDSLTGPCSGMCWHVGFGFRGKKREADIELTEFTAPEKLVFQTVTDGLEVQTDVELVALSRGRTRVGVVSTLVPKTLAARLLVQSLKLAKGNINTRFRKRMGGFAKDLEDRLARSA